ncbi:TRAP transporter small permease subunit [uncultured Oscillibacter sp.]|uniref:TRAP transporter small permease n=1 Tax=uncultured Oscillibacter sp. TaxID=876091 RepID=UPI0028056A5F|nr:TRAP transporter small permease subunit [uncultured Oscillibacter sp.]
MEKKLVKILENACALCLCILVVAVACQVISREILHAAATWTTEIGRAMFLAVVFLGTPILIIEEGQMAVTMIKDMASRKKTTALLFNVIGDLVIYFGLFTLTYGAYNRTLAEWHTMIPTVEWITYGYLYLVMLIGCLSMIFMQVRRTKKYILSYLAKEET